MNAAERARLAQAVQTNCHIADARHAADMTLCIYLLQMREFFRWERGLPFGAALPRAEVGAWIAERESLWSSIEEDEFVALPLIDGAESVDPFDIDAVNAQLGPAGWLYGAGLSASERPVFFLAELHGQALRGGLPVLTAGRELARGLVAPPAALGRHGGSEAIIVRRESLARWGWEKFEAFALKRPAGSPFHAVVEAHGLEHDFESALPRWVDELAETMVLHELGEHHAGHLLGPGWAAMRLALPTRRADLYARAVRDHLADLSVTLPTLLERGATAPIHFWFANFDGVRELLFPALKSGYAAWRQGDGGQALRRAAASGAAHFTRLAQQAIALHARGGAAAGVAIEHLLTAPGAVCAG